MCEWLGFITPRSAVRSCPPLPIISTLNEHITLLFDRAFPEFFRNSLRHAHQHCFGFGSCPLWLAAFSRNLYAYSPLTLSLLNVPTNRGLCMGQPPQHSAAREGVSPVPTRCDPASSASPISRSIRSLVAPTPLGSATREPKRSPEKAFAAATSARLPGVGFVCAAAPPRRHHPPSPS